MGGFTAALVTTSPTCRWPALRRKPGILEWRTGSKAFWLKSLLAQRPTGAKTFRANGLLEVGPRPKPSFARWLMAGHKAAPPSGLAPGRCYLRAPAKWQAWREQSGWGERGWKICRCVRTLTRRHDFKAWHCARPFFAGDGGCAMPQERVSIAFGMVERAINKYLTCDT